MANLKDSLDRITKAGADVAAAEAARRALVEQFDKDGSAEATHAVADALWRLGLLALLHHKKTDDALALFKRAVDKKDPEASPHARTSLALVMHAKGKAQQAVFELRKVITPSPTPASAHALNLLCTMLRDQKAKPSEIEKADKDRMAALDALLKSAKDGTPDAAHWKVQLALAHREAGSRSEAKRMLQEVVRLGADGAGAETHDMAHTVLKQMG